MRELNKLAVLHCIVEEGQAPGYGVGLMSVQRFAYLLQQDRGIPLKYEFDYHYLRPYSDELWSDLCRLQSWGYLDIAPTPSNYGYMIAVVKSPSWQTSRVVSKARKAIKELWIYLKDEAPCNLGLYTETHFMYSCLRDANRPANEEAVVENVTALYPRICPDEVRQVYRGIITREV
jgi:hypothetical protein